MFSDNLNPVEMVCGKDCGSGGGSGINGVTADTEIDFTTTTPVVGTNYNVITNDIAGTLAGFMLGATFNLAGSVAPPSPSPYGSNPVSYPCCTPVTAGALTGATIHAPDVDSFPLVLLFIVLLALTLGGYLVLSATRKGKKQRQYEIRL